MKIYVPVHVLVKLASPAKDVRYFAGHKGTYHAKRHKDGDRN